MKTKLNRIFENLEWYLCGIAIATPSLPITYVAVGVVCVSALGRIVFLREPK